MAKIKLLFVVDGFYQAGAERFMHEVDCVLDKNKYDITLLDLEKEREIRNNWGVRHYEEKHRVLGSKIVFLDSLLITRNIRSRIVSKFKKLLHKKSYNRNIDPKALNRFVADYDIINWIGEYTMFHELDPEHLKKSLVFIMSAKFQYVDIYKDFDFNYNYTFVSGFLENECKYEFSQFKEVTHYYFPLLLNVPFQQNPWKFEDSSVKKIGIFTRLSYYKPLDPFFYSFHLLLEKLPNCELHVFGNGDPVEEVRIARYLIHLGIGDKVFFRGHQNNIITTVLEEKINLSWFQGYNNNRPAGYAGLDICSTGTPLVCWDFMENPMDEFNEVYPHYKNLNKFVNKSYEILTDMQSAHNLSQLQFNEVNLNRDINKNINLLYEVYSEILYHK
jgi:glycosyltransferase involved in cell wall biosynthesis